MQHPISNTYIQQLEAELREEKSKFAKAFHSGKSLSELKDVVDRIHMLEKKFKAFIFQGFKKK